MAHIITHPLDIDDAARLMDQDGYATVQVTLSAREYAWSLENRADGYCGPYETAHDTAFAFGVPDDAELRELETTPTSVTLEYRTYLPQWIAQTRQERAGAHKFAAPTAAHERFRAAGVPELERMTARCRALADDLDDCGPSVREVQDALRLASALIAEARDKATLPSES